MWLPVSDETNQLIHLLIHVYQLFYSRFSQAKSQTIDCFHTCKSLFFFCSRYWLSLNTDQWQKCKSPPRWRLCIRLSRVNLHDQWELPFLTKAGAMFKVHKLSLSFSSSCNIAFAVPNSWCRLTSKTTVAPLQ